MTRRFKLFLLPIAIILLALTATAESLYYYKYNKAYDFYYESEHCRVFPSVVMELGFENALTFEAMRYEDEDGFAYFKIAEWTGIQAAARDCVDMGG